jgi:hypothetical protein
MSTDVDASTATRIYLEGGHYVRVSETVQEVFERIESLDDRWAPVTDPGDGREKLIRSNRVLWIEQEAER